MKKDINYAKTVALLFTIVLFISASAAQAETEISLTATANASSASYTPDKAVDDNLNTCWMGKYSWKGEPAWLRLDCGESYDLTRISVWWDYYYGATNYDIQASEDGQSWTSLYTGLNSASGSGSPSFVSYTLSAKARFIRIYISQLARFYPRIYEVKIYIAGVTNQAPQATIDSISPNPAGQGDTVSFSGHGTDSDGTITGYNWRSSIDGTLSTASSFTKSTLSPGSHTIYFKVKDDKDAWSAEVSKVLSIVLNQPPTAEASADHTSGEAPLEVQFTGGGTDPDGTITGYSWDFGDGKTSSLQNPTHTYETAGSYTAILTVTDNDGATGTASVAITVTEPTVEIPHLIGFQARLGDAEETSLNGTFTITFRLYDREEGGEPLWQEVQELDVEDGLLDVKLGSQTALNLPFDRPYWLGVEVGSDGEMVPRFELTAVPYSFKSAQ